MNTAWTGKALLRIGGGCVIGAVAILATGCDANHVLGAVDSGPPPADDGGLPPASDGGTPLIDASPDLPHPTGTQTWTGYVENYRFPSSSDAVKIAFTVDSAGQVTGTVVMGNGTPPPPATDPNVGYPPDYEAQQPVAVGAPPYIAEGYAYTMRAGTMVGQRLRFGVSLSELWRDWCALQTPVPGASSCVPNWGAAFSSTGCYQVDPATNQMVTIDCGKLSLCWSGMVCRCDASGCQTQDTNINMFDISINDDRADGSMDTHNVHFTRDP
ncbi:MAG TPA: hypothetical protein VIF57_03480 [Polyangia bacterium]|jgi:hypothetical protein